MTDEPLTVGPYVLERRDVRALSWAVRRNVRNYLYSLFTSLGLMVGLMSLTYLVTRQIFRWSGMEDVFDAHEPLVIFAGYFAGIFYLLFGARLFGVTPSDARLTSRQRHLSISPWGIEASAGETKSSLPWGEILRVSVTRKHVFLFLTRTTAFIAPVRVFASSDQAKAFGEKARAWYAAALAKS